MHIAVLLGLAPASVKQRGDSGDAGRRGLLFGIGDARQTRTPISVYERAKDRSRSTSILVAALDNIADGDANVAAVLAAVGLWRAAPAPVK